MLSEEKDVKSEDNRSNLPSLYPNCETIRFYIVDLAQYGFGSEYRYCRAKPLSTSIGL